MELVEPPVVLGLGRTALSLHGLVPRLTQREDAHELAELSLQVGGVAPTATATAASLGCRARFVTKLADGLFASFLSSSIRAAGVELREIRASDARLSTLRINIMDEANRRASFFSVGDAGQLLASELDADDLLAEVSAVVIDCEYPAAQKQLAQSANARGVPVICIATQVEDEIVELLRYVNILIATEEFAGELAPRGELPDSLAELRKLGPDAVVILLGEAGSIGLHKDELLEQPAFEVETVDARGACGVYTGAFAAALLSRLPFARCMTFASAAAALSCMRRGAWAGAPQNRDAVIELIRRGPRLTAGTETSA